MKKYLVCALVLVLILALALLTGCGGSDTNDEATGSSTESKTSDDSASSSVSSNATAGHLSPPAWLIGEWYTADASQDIKVTADNVVLGSGNLDMNWQIDNVGLEVTESTDDNFYSLAYMVGDVNFSYTFALQDDGTMVSRVSVEDLGVDQIYTKR